MTKYKCGHNSNITILNENVLSMAFWLEWCKTVGFEGDKSMCFDCYCKEKTQ